MQNPFLIGSAIYLRPLDLADAPTLVQWLNDPEVTRTLRRCDPVMLLKEEAWLRQRADSENDITLAIMVRGSEEFIGVCGLHQIDQRCRHAAFGIVIGSPPHWGR